MPEVEGAGRKLSVEWTMVNKTDNKAQVAYKFSNHLIGAKIENIIIFLFLVKNSPKILGCENSYTSRNIDIFCIFHNCVASLFV